MILTKKLFFLLLLILSPCAVVLSQIQGSGKEFWIGYMDNYRVEPNSEYPNGLIDRAILEIVAVEDASGRILYKGQESPFNLTEGQSFTYIFPESSEIISRQDGVVENNGIQVLSEGNIMVYAYNQRERSMDAASILPYRELADEYWVIDHNANFMGPEATFDGVTEAASSFLIVGIEDGTTVEIIPRNTTFDGKAFNTPYNITLQSGQTYQVKSRNLLTGSKVRVIQEEGECKRVAVFAGNRWGNNGGVGPDNSHMYVQMLGYQHISTEFIHVPSLPVGGLDQVGFFSPDLEGYVSVNGTFDLNPLGLGILTFNLPFAPSFLEMTNPGFAMLKFTSLSTTGGRLGDPATTYLLGLDQMVSQSLFFVRDIPTIDQHMIIIVVEESSKDLTLLDGVNIGGDFQTHPNIPGYAYARKIISLGVHKLENPEGFNAYQYGYGFNESYVLTLFQSDKSLECEVNSSYDFEVEGDHTACLLQEGTWRIQPEDPLFIFFAWDFGDGSDTKSGKEIMHTYTEPGIYEIVIEASMTEDPCEIPEIFKVEVVVKDNRGEILGPERVCPEVDEFDYFFIPDGEIEHVEWVVEGGVIVEELANFGIKILWGPPNENAFVSAIAFTSEGCPSEEITLSVIIRRVLEPQLPIGPEISCVSLGEPILYEIPEILPNRGYRWFVEGGEVIGANGNSIVQVNWSTTENSGQIWYEEFSMNDEFCEGISDPLEVSLVDALVVQIAENMPVDCHGEATGWIELEVLGGSGNYTFEWSHDPSLDSHLAENLSAGIYSVTVTDASGCIGDLQEIEISEPPILETIGDIEVENASCYGKSDGQAIINVSGGTPPYTVDLPGAEVNEGVILLHHLEAGVYEIAIQDANQCLIRSDFTIGSPMPLEVEVRIEKQSCPGGNNGVLLAVPQGGMEPFRYNWKGLGVDHALADGLTSGEYEVEVVDGNGCIGMGKIRLLDAPPQLRMPTGFFPEADVLYSGVSNCPIGYELKVFNRWGQLIYFGTSGWDGFVEGVAAPTGTYTYRIEYSFSIDGTVQSENQIGTFVLLR